MRLCIAHPSKGTYSETFIRDHIALLPFEVTGVYAQWGNVPRFQTADDAPLGSLGDRLIRKITGFRAKGYDAEAKVNQEVFGRWLVRNQIDVVMSEYGVVGADIVDACNKHDVPLVVHFHGYDAHSVEVWKEYGARYEHLFAHAQAFIAVSKHMREHLISMGAPPEKTHWNPCGVETTKFTASNPAEAPPVFLSVGRFVDKKAPHLAILAFQKVWQECPDARLVMIGDGPLLDACSQMVQALNLESCVELLGSCSHEVVAERMKGARAFIQHSVTASNGDSEGTPVAVLEAGASGIPVVATAHAGIRDVVEHERSGFLVPERDIDGMATYLCQLARDAELAGEMGRFAREHICDKFSMDHSIARLAAAISGVTSNAT